jgi:large subunit ribosomal protein L30
MAKKDKIVTIKLIKSPLGYKKDQRDTVKALGLRKINQERKIKDNLVSRGMIFKVKHLVEII